MEEKIIIWISDDTEMMSSEDMPVSEEEFNRWEKEMLAEGLL